MNTYMFRAVVAVFVILFTAMQAGACGRCGRGGGFCHFAPAHHVHHAPHVPQASVTNFIFNSQYPAGIPYFPAQGASVFGYGGGYGPSGFALAAQAQYIDPALTLDRSGRLAELSIQGGQAATAQFNASANQALALNDQLNQRANNTAIAAVAIQALQNNQQPAPQAQALKVSIKSTGETVAEWLPAEGGEAEFKLQGGPEISLTCAKCHSAEAAKAPKGFSFNGQSMTQAESDWAQEAVWAGKMPPNSKLDRAGKSAVAKKLQSLVK